MAIRTLLDLEEDILHIILSVSSPTSLCTVSRVSKTTHRLANPMIWRTVRIGKEIEVYYNTVDLIKPVEKPFLGRDGMEDLLSKTYLLELVREIVVQDIGAKKELFTDLELAHIIKNAKTLLKFSWNPDFSIGQRSLVALEERKPDVELHATRQLYVYSCDPLDLRLLSSRLLKELTHNVAWTRTSLFSDEKDNDTLRSQIEEMDSILSRSNSIRVLDLRLNILNSISSSKIAIVDLKTIEYIPHRIFDNILSLDIPADYGNANRSPASHRLLTSLLVSCLHKWKSVHELHLGGLHAPYTFQHLKDRVPNLKRLDLMFPAAHSNRGELAPELVAQFLLVLENLEELKIRDMDQKEVDVVSPAIVAKKHMLRSLDLYACANLYEQAPVWAASHFDELLTNSTITKLALHVSIPTLIAWAQPASSSPANDHSPPTTPTPAVLTTLRTLKLTTHVPTDHASIFSAQYDYDFVDGSVPPPPVDVEKAKELAIGIFRSVGRAENGKRLGLELCVVNLAVWDRGQTEEIRRSVFVRGGGAGGDGLVVDVREANV